MEMVDAIFSNALSSDVAYENLRILCETTDTFDQVNRREMQPGTAAMAALIYLLDAMDVVR